MAPWLKQSSWSRDLALLALVGLFCFSILSLRDPVASEVRYIESAREMLASGDWVVPTLSYVPYFEKPPLTYWCGAVAQWLCGESNLAVRLPSILAAIGSLMLTYALGRHWRNPGFALKAAFLLLFTGYFFVMSSAMVTDPLFSLWLLLAWYAFARHDADGAGGGWIWLFWLALGLALLTKGPLAVVLVGLSLGAYLLFSGRLAQIWRMRLITGTLVMIAINAPWSWLVFKRDPRFLEFFYVRENFQAFFDGNINHPGPPYFYLGVLAIVLFPWSFLALGAAGLNCARTFTPRLDGWWQRWCAALGFARAQPATPLTATAAAEMVEPASDRLRLYLTCALVLPLLFLSASASKLPTYILPLVPVLILLVMDHLDRHASHPEAWQRWATPVQVGAGLVGGLGYAIYWFIDNRGGDAKALDLAYLPPIVVALVLALAGLVWGAVAAWRGRQQRSLVILALSTAAAMLLLSPIALDFRADYDARKLAKSLSARLAADEVVVVEGSTVQDYTVVRVLHRRVAIYRDARELGMGHFVEVTPTSEAIPRLPKDINGENLPKNAWLYSWARLQAAWAAPKRLWFFAYPASIKALKEAGLPVYELGAIPDATLITNQPLTPAP